MAVKAYRIKYKTKDGEELLSGLIAASQIKSMLKAYMQVYSNCTVVDFGENY